MAGFGATYLFDFGFGARILNIETKDINLLQKMYDDWVAKGSPGEFTDELDRAGIWWRQIRYDMFGASGIVKKPKKTKAKTEW